MSNLSHLKAGDPVRVFEVNGHPPAGGWEGKVESVGRKYLVIAFFRSLDGPEHEIRVQISDGRSPDQYRRFTVQTPDEADEAVRRSEALATLRSVRIRYDGDCREQASTEMLEELAAVVIRHSSGKAE
jgi:hypothetical protein